MSKREPHLLVEDIINSSTKILKYTEGLTLKEFVNDSKIIDAVIWRFEVINEATNRLPEDFKEQHSDIDWHKISSFKNGIIPDGFKIDFSVLWEIIYSVLPSLISQLQGLLR